MARGPLRRALRRAHTRPIVPARNEIDPSSRNTLFLDPSRLQGVPTQNSGRCFSLFAKYLRGEDTMANSVSRRPRSGVTEAVWVLRIAQRSGLARHPESPE